MTLHLPAREDVRSRLIRLLAGDRVVVMNARIDLANRICVAVDSDQRLLPSGIISGTSRDDEPIISNVWFFCDPEAKNPYTAYALDSPFPLNATFTGCRLETDHG